MQPEKDLEKVFAWLEAGGAADYQAGVLLLQEHSGNRSLVNLLLKKESVANREKLVYELCKCACGGRMEDLSEVVNHFAQAVQGAVPEAPMRGFLDAVGVARPEAALAFPEQPVPEHVPAELQAQADDLTQLMATLYNQRCQLSNRLAELDPADGPRVVGEILALEQQYNALAQKRRNLANPPTAPGQPTAPAEQPAPEAVALGAEQPVAPGIDRAELMKKRQSLMSNRSKARKAAETAKTEAKKSEYEQKAAKLDIELQQVEMQLKA